MKLSSVYALALAAGAVGFVIPDQTMMAELQPERAGLRDEAENMWSHAADDFKSVTDTLAEEIYGSAREFKDSFDGAMADGLESLESLEQMAADAMVSCEDELTSFVEGDGDGDDDTEKHTLYELIKKSKYTTRIAKLLEEHDDLKELLDSADKEHTFFVPTDKALERLPKHKDGKGPSKEVIKAVLQYHLVPETNLFKKLLSVNTLPTLLGGGQLSHDPAKTPQRLTIGFGLGGIHINKFVRVVLGNVRGSNGVIHAVNHLLIPPPRLGGVVTLFPTVFSQFDLAFKKTNLGDEIAYNEHYGATLFVPSAHAWPKLGYKANAFLFSKWGNKYLKALLLYHVVANQTLYTDHFYGPEGDDKASIPKGRVHLDLPTLLHGKTVSVDIGRYGPLRSMHVNHFSRVVQNDIVARDGVIQIVNSVLIPPHKKHGHHDGDSEIAVQDLVERLEPFMAAEDCVEVEDELDWLNLEL